MHKPLLIIALGLAFYGVDYLLLVKSHALRQEAALLPIKPQLTGPGGRDDDFFNTPVLSDLPETPEERVMRNQSLLLLGASNLLHVLAHFITVFGVLVLILRLIVRFLFDGHGTYRKPASDSLPPGEVAGAPPESAEAAG